MSAGLNPNFAFPDEENGNKTPSESLFHSPYKTYLFLHPTSVLLPYIGEAITKV